MGISYSICASNCGQELPLDSVPKLVGGQFHWSALGKRMQNLAFYRPIYIYIYIISKHNACTIYQYF
jgi:hypothetical protein